MVRLPPLHRESRAGEKLRQQGGRGEEEGACSDLAVTVRATHPRLSTARAGDVTSQHRPFYATSVRDNSGAPDKREKPGTEYTSLTISERLH